MPESNDSRASVLIIDDEPAHRELVRILLQREGVAVYEASTGEEGVAVATSRTPDLVLLDVFMPGEDGFATLERLKDIGPENAHVVIFSILENPDSKQKALDLGAEDYITKPFDMNRMVGRVLELLDLARTGPDQA
jgi:DNA-binding response OmpR family regulator